MQIAASATATATATQPWAYPYNLDFESARKANVKPNILRFDIEASTNENHFAEWNSPHSRVYIGHLHKKSMQIYFALLRMYMYCPSVCFEYIRQLDLDIRQLHNIYRVVLDQKEKYKNTDFGANQRFLYYLITHQANNAHYLEKGYNMYGEYADMVSWMGTGYNGIHEHDEMLTIGGFYERGAGIDSGESPSTYTLDPKKTNLDSFTQNINMFPHQPFGMVAGIPVVQGEQVKSMPNVSMYPTIPMESIVIQPRRLQSDRSLKVNDPAVPNQFTTHALWEDLLIAIKFRHDSDQIDKVLDNTITDLQEIIHKDPTEKEGQDAISHFISVNSNHISATKQMMGIADSFEKVHATSVLTGDLTNISKQISDMDKGNVGMTEHYSIESKSFLLILSELDEKKLLTFARSDDAWNKYERLSKWFADQKQPLLTMLKIYKTIDTIVESVLRPHQWHSRGGAPANIHYCILSICENIGLLFKYSESDAKGQYTSSVDKTLTDLGIEVTKTSTSQHIVTGGSRKKTGQNGGKNTSQIECIAYAHSVLQSIASVWPRRVMLP